MACTDDIRSRQGSETGTLVVEAALGERVAIDGEPRSDLTVGAPFDLPAGYHTVAVAQEGCDWSEPVSVEVTADHKETVRIPWHHLAARRTITTAAGPPDGQDSTRLGDFDEKSGPGSLYDSEMLQKFAALETGDSPSGPFVEISDPKGPLRYLPLSLRDGDKLFTVDGKPVDSIAPLARAIRSFYKYDADPPTWSIMRDGQKVVMTTERKAIAPSDDGTREASSPESTTPE